MAAPAFAPRRAPARKAPARKPAGGKAAAGKQAARGSASPSSTRTQRNARAIANARTRQRAAAAPATRPAPARRKSGAATKPRSAPAASPVARVLNSRGMPLLDRILRGPAWVVMLGVLLAGIVFLNVSVLELNRGIARTDAKASELERTNSALRSRVAKLDSGERVQELAAERGYFLPQPGDVTFLRGRATDARLAAQRIAPPADETTGTTITAAPATTTPAPTSITTAPASATTTQTGYSAGVAASVSAPTTQVP